MNKIVDVPTVKVVKKSINVPKYVDKIIEVEKQQEIPVEKTRVVDVETPYYVDRIIKHPKVKVVDVPVYTEKVI